MLQPEEQKILQKHLIQFLVEDVFNTITENDILKVLAPNVWEHKGVKLTAGQVEALKAEARAFQGSGLWQILKAECIYIAQQEGFTKSKTEYDIIASKMLIYLTNIIDTKLKTMTRV